MPPMKSELISQIDAAWNEFITFLAGLTEQQMMDLYDDQGWNIRDHVTHLAAWEEIIGMLVQRKAQFEFLGVDSSQLPQKPIDEINAIFREYRQNLPIAAAIEVYRSCHQGLITSLQTLTDADLDRPAGRFLPLFKPDDSRAVVEIIHDNADRHIAEHMPWIQTIAKITKRA
jgi:hypothetical protein